MGILYCDGERFRKSLIAGASWLSENSETLNRLNVFPVPDGDTGTNMSLTLISAVDGLNDMEGAPLQEVLEASARGALMGARGCSGVIISQLIAGFAEGSGAKTKITSQDIAVGLQIGTKRAYQSVTEPREGTILTVIREASEEADQVAKTNDDLVQLLEKVLERAKISLENTPNLLPVLAQAGVVDAGGQGLVYMLEGMLKLIYGEELEISGRRTKEADEILPVGVAQSRVPQLWNNQYCTEFILSLKNPDIQNLRGKFANFGEDLVVVGWNELVRVHIHTNDPEKVLAYAHSHGKPMNVKIDDMRKQHRHIIQKPIMTEHIEEKREVSIVTTAPGDGMAAICKSLGVDLVIITDQMKNPSVSELIRAVDDAYSDKVLLLPNDSNIIPSAIQSANMSHKQVRIIPTKNISQGLSAIVAFRLDLDIEDNASAMESALKMVKHGEIARSVRDTQYRELMIKENDIIGRFDGKILVAVSDLEEAAMKLLEKMVDPDDEIITIFYGADVSRDEAEKIAEKVGSAFPEIEIELHYGGQPHRFYILSVE